MPAIDAPSIQRQNATQPEVDLHSGLEAVILAHTEGDPISIRLSNHDAIVGVVTGAELVDQGTLFDTPSRYRLLIESSKTEFLLTMWYLESDDEKLEAEALDLRLVGPADWSIPIDLDVIWVR